MMFGARTRAAQHRCCACKVHRDFAAQRRGLGRSTSARQPTGAGKRNRVCVLALLLWRDVGIVSDSRTFQRGMSSRDSVKLKLRPFEIPEYSELGECGISIDDRRGDRFH